MGKTPICKLCRLRPAAVPDREKMRAVWRREVCRECHAERLRGDLAEVAASLVPPRNPPSEDER